MAEKLPWFKFYAQDWLTDPRVLRLSNEQRGVYLWLLCRQWHDGSLPYDVHDVYPLLPPGSESPSVVYVLTTFFPPDPDTNERRNTRLAEQQEERASAYESRVKSAGNARKARSRKSLQDNAVSGDQTGDQGKNQNQKVELESENNQQAGEPMLFHVRCAMVANQCLQDNPHASRGETDLKPLRADMARQVVEDWLGGGIPENVILGAIQRVCGAFRSTPENPRIGSWRYFDAAVRKDWAASRGDVALDRALANLK